MSCLDIWESDMIYREFVNTCTCLNVLPTDHYANDKA